MEMQFFILGHLMLLAILFASLLVASAVDTAMAPESASSTGESLVSLIFIFTFFEIIYWGLQWLFVP